MEIAKFGNVTPQEEWDAHVQALTREASHLGKWMRLLMMWECHRRLHPQLTTVAKDRFVDDFMVQVGKSLGARATLYRILLTAEILVIVLGVDGIRRILGTPVANEHALLRKIARIENHDQARDVVTVAVDGAGARVAHKLADGYLREQSMVDDASAATPLVGGTSGGGLLNTVLFGDALTRLKELPDAHVQTCVTSPPFFALRDFGTRTWFGGDAACDHDRTIERPPHHRGQVPSSVGGESSAAGGNAVTHSCGKCGAWFGQLGLEPTVDEYIKHLVTVFAEVHRVLRDDGTCWVEIDDTYLHKAKQLVPERLAIALAEAGWLVRGEIIWYRSNPMPETVTDRPTRAHSTIWMLVKSERYFYDASAVQEPASGKKPRRRFHANARGTYDKRTDHFDAPEAVEARNLRSVWTIPTTRKPGSEHCAVYPSRIAETCIRASTRPGHLVLDPFAGSGTTLATAKRLGRRYIGIEINEREYRSEIERTLAVVQDEANLGD